MTDPAAPPVDPAAPPAAVPPAATAAPPPAATRPDWLPENFWDAKANALNTDDFGKHFVELTAAQTKLAELTAKVPPKPEDYKLEVKLPDTVKVPDGMKLEINDKDPRIPLLRQVAHAHGLSQDAVTSLVALDAQMQIEAHKRDVAAFAEDQKKLGEKAKDRIDAAQNWGKTLNLSAAQADEFRLLTQSSAGVELVETLMKKVAGNVPGTQPARDPAPAPKTLAERMYPNLPSGLPTISARSA